MITHQIVIERQVETPAELSDAAIHSLVSHALKAEGVDEPWELGIQFMDDDSMQAAHVEYMDIDEPTDIMTFPYSDDDDVWGGDEVGGDLMISVDRAAANAEDAGWSLADELSFLIIHGVLHLLGWDDHSDEDRARMLARQREILDSWTDRS